MDLEEDVAELVEQLGVVAGVRRRGELVGLLDRVRDDRALVLLAVPGALAAEPAGELVEGRDRRGYVLRRAHPPVLTATGSGVGRRRRLDRAGRRRRRRLRRVLAVLRHVVLAALRLLLPLLAEVLDERVERLLLVLRRQHLLDRRLGLLERLLRGLGDLVDLEDVVAELRLDRAVDLALLGLEDRVVERLLLLALGDGGQLAALRLGGVVDRVLLGDRLERLAGLERRLGLVGLGLRLGQDDAQVAPLGLRELGLVLVVVVLDLLVGDLCPCPWSPCRGSCARACRGGRACMTSSSVWPESLRNFS